MKVQRFAVLTLAVSLMLPLGVRAAHRGDSSEEDDRDRRESDHHEHAVKTPVHLAGVITVPGNPITSADIAWLDRGTERYYFADRSNFGVDIIDAETDLYEARVAGMAGPLTSGGGTSTTNGPGPNGVVVTPHRQLWAGDGNSTVKVANVDPGSIDYLKILASVNTANVECDTNTPPGNPVSLTGHWCGRADELGFDPKDHLILVANNAPLSPTVTTCVTVANPNGHCPADPYATLIDAKTYAVLGQIFFKGAGGLEQPLWDPELRRFWITVPGPAGGNNPMIARINPTRLPLTIDKSIVLDCKALTGATSASITGIALAPFQHLLVSACGFPIAVNAITGTATLITKNVGGGDEVWYNPGDGRFYVTGPSADTPPLQQLGVLDAEHGTWLQNVPDMRGKNPAAFAETNHIFTIVQIPAANANSAPPPLLPTMGDPSKDDSVCTQFGFRGTGCIAVFTHLGEEDDDN